MSPVRERYAGLDSSRGLAALMVFFVHFLKIYFPALSQSHLLNHTPAHILIDGDAAVLYFFILSGYVLTISMKNEHTGMRYFIAYYARRIFRIYPAFIVTALVTFLLINFLKNSSTSQWLHLYWQNSPTLHDLFSQLILILRHPNDPALRLLPHDWTLTVELFVSFLLPALIITSRLRAELVLLLSYVTIKVLPIDPFLFDFSIGVYLALKKEFLINQWKKLSVFGHVILCILVVLIMEIDQLNFDFVPVLKKVIIHPESWALIYILISVLSSARLQRLLERKPLLLLGKISYSFYLFHLVILAIVAINLPFLSPYLSLPLNLLLVTFTSTFSYFLIEKPFMVAGSILSNRING